MSNFKEKPQGRTLKLAPGFYVFRYLCQGSGDLPVATLGYAPGGNGGQVSFVGHREHGQVVLSAYGDMAVAHVEGGDGAVALNLFIPESFPQRAVDIQIERLQAEAKTEVSRPTAPVQPKSLVTLSGHVERQGDVEVSAGHWLGDPAGKSRIEGFSILWPQRPYGVDLAYHCTIPGMGESPSTLTGGFVGTRRRATPISAIKLEMIGEKAGEFELVTEAVFAKRGSVIGRSGELLSGLGDADFLVALRTLVVSGTSKKMGHVTLDNDSTQREAVDGAPRVQTFRSQQNQSETTHS